MNTLTHLLGENIAANKIPSLHSLLLEKIPTDLTKSHVAGGAILLFVSKSGNFSDFQQKITKSSIRSGAIRLLVNSTGYVSPILKKEAILVL